MGEGYFYLKKAKDEMTDFKDVRLQYQLKPVKELSDIQVKLKLSYTSNYIEHIG